MLLFSITLKEDVRYHFLKVFDLYGIGGQRVWCIIKYKVVGMRKGDNGRECKACTIASSNYGRKIFGLFALSSSCSCFAEGPFGERGRQQ